MRVRELVEAYRAAARRGGYFYWPSRKPHFKPRETGPLGVLVDLTEDRGGHLSGEALRDPNAEARPSGSEDR